MAIRTVRKQIIRASVFKTIISILFFALPLSSLVADEFRIPRELEPRVDFWVDVFTKYGEHHAIIHHRDYPQAVFDVVDFYGAAKRLSESQLEKHKKKIKKQKQEAVENILRGLANKTRLDNDLARRVEDAMTYVPGGDEKFLKTIKDKKIRSQQGIKEKYKRAVERSGRYLPIIERIFVKEYGLPIELTRLPFIESSFDYLAYSSVGAAGIWQFMRGTAKSYMKVNWLVDERRDVIAATRGAAQYLKQAHKTLKSWPLAITSYNHGVGGVKKRIKEMGTRDLIKMIEHPKKRVFGFASNNFYPEFLAAIKVYNSKNFYFKNLNMEKELYVKEYKLPNSFSVSHLVNRLGIPRDTLKDYNYALSKHIWNGRNRVPKGYNLKIPKSYESQLVKLNAPQPTSGSSSVVYGPGTYKVRSGDNLIKISRKFGTSVSSLKSLNNLKSDVLRIGQVLKVKSSSSSKAVVGGATTSYTVKKGDTLGLIATRYKTTVSRLKSLNRLSGSRIYVGQKVKVPATTMFHTVRNGENLWRIAKKYGLSVTQLKKLNGMKGSLLKVGQKLRVK